MRSLLSGLLGFVVVTGAEAQWYGGYPPYQTYYGPYPNPNVTVVYPPAVPSSPSVVLVPDGYSRQRQITYFIAFHDSAIRLADAYWVSGNTLYYVTRDHQQRTAPLNSVDRTLTERLNNEQNVTFYLPAQTGKAELRRLLEQQLNLIIQTRNTSSGLIVVISDVLFDHNQYTLTPSAREKLAKVAGILVAYGGLCPHLEGYTDNTGSDEYNLQLSRRRADVVRDYLVSQGVAAANLTVAGLGEANPVASNATAAGRQQNRRVEMLIPGDVIGIAVNSAPPD